jgi:hypothetical protein
LISAFWIARITGMSHWCLASKDVFKEVFLLGAVAQAWNPNRQKLGGSQFKSYKLKATEKLGLPTSILYLSFF